MNIYAMKKPKRINSVSVTFFILALVVGYVGYFFVPIYWPVFQLSGIMRGVCYDAYRYTNDEQLMTKLLQDGRRTGLKLSKDNFRLTRIGYEAEELRTLSKGNSRLKDILAERGKACRLEMHYEDDYALPFTSKTVHLKFDKTVEQTLEQVEYDTCTCVSLPEPD